MHKPVVEEFGNRVRRELYNHYDKLGVINGTVYRFDEDKRGMIQRKIVLPAQQISSVIDLVHGSALGGHLGWEKTLAKLRERVFRPGLRKLVMDHVHACHQCQISKPMTSTRPRAELQPLKPLQPFELITTDIVGPLPLSKKGNKYILVVCDHFSKWTQAYPLEDITAETVAKKIVQFGFIFGLCTNLLSDQGKNFQSELLKQVCELLDINHVRTSPYHPEGDGLTERFNRTLKAMIRTTIGEDQRDWDEQLDQLCFAYNTATHSTTGTTPFEVVYGRKPKLPLDLLISDKTYIDEVGTLRSGNGLEHTPSDATERIIRESPSEEQVGEYVKQLKFRLVSIFEAVTNMRDIKVEKQKIQYERNLKPFNYEVGELVLRLNKATKKGVSKKLSPVWLPHPYKIVKKMNRGINYAIRRADKPNARITVVHHNNLKKYVDKGNSEADNTTLTQSNHEPSITSQPEPAPIEHQPSTTTAAAGRPRGRPRKNTQTIVPTTIAAKPATRPRGRPRKNPPLPPERVEQPTRRGSRTRQPPRRLGVDE